MKTLAISLSFIFSVFVHQTALAEETTAPVQATEIDTIVVVAQPEPANFEIFSLRHAEEAINEVLDIMQDSYSVMESAASLIDVAINVGS